MHRSRIAILVLSAVLALAAAGCGSSPPTRFYILEATATGGGGGSPDKVIGIGPVAFPPYLDRSEMVAVSNGTRLDLSDFDQWGEPLSEGFLRVLTEDLSVLMGTQRVHAYPWPSSAKVEAGIGIDVIRFDVDQAGRAMLIARWSVRGADGAVVVPARRSGITEAAGGADHGARAKAMSRCVGKLAVEIAKAIP
jgi:uncharacterized lipoprotein YmbA